MGPPNSNTVSEFGSLLRTYRRQAGLTQRELAGKAGLSVAALRDFEQSRRHRPRSNSLAALTDALDLDPAQTADLTAAAALPRRRPDALLPSPRLPLHDSYLTGQAHPPGSSAGLWLAALGPLEAWSDGTPLYLGPPRGGGC